MQLETMQVVGEIPAPPQDVHEAEDTNIEGPHMAITQAIDKSNITPTETPKTDSNKNETPTEEEM